MNTFIFEPATARCYFVHENNYISVYTRSSVVYNAITIMADFDIYASAYCKLILHCAKYPHCAINGVLLTDKTKNKDTGNITIVDAIPLFHLSLGLSPMMEVALTQV